VGGFEFTCTIIRQLNLQRPGFRGFLEHLDLDLAGHIPRRLPALRRIERKDQTSPLSRRYGCRLSRKLLPKCIDCSTLIRWDRRNLIVGHVSLPGCVASVTDQDLAKAMILLGCVTVASFSEQCLRHAVSI